MITSEQMRAARAMLRMDQKVLSERSGVSLATIKRLEGLPGALTANRPTLAAIRATLETAGIIFVSDNGDGRGVRLRNSLQTAADVDGRIELLEAKVASIPEPGEPSPETGMNIMNRALVENELTGLRSRRKRLRKPKRKDTDGASDL